MKLFEDERYRKFFNPLQDGQNKKHYYNCILRLIEKSDRISVFYEDDAKDVIISYFKENNLFQNTELEKASEFIKYFRECGWISERELGRRGNDYIFTIDLYCYSFIRKIEEITLKDNNQEFSNKIFSIYEILNSLKSDSNDGRKSNPYRNIFKPIVEHTRSLRDELNMLKTNIKSVLRIVEDTNAMKDIGKIIVSENSILEKFFHDYFLIKKKGLVNSYIFKITIMLKELKETDYFNKIIKEYQEVSNKDFFEAKQDIELEYENIICFLSNGFQEKMQNIDNEVNKYFRLLSSRISIILKVGGTDFQTKLKELLILLKTMNPEIREEILDNCSNFIQIYSHQYLDLDSLSKKKEISNERRKEIDLSVLNQELDLTNEFLDKYSNLYNINSVNDYFDERLANDNCIYFNDSTIRSKKDVLMLISAFINFSNNKLKYKVEELEGTFENDVVRMNKYKIERK